MPLKLLWVQARCCSRGQLACASALHAVRGGHSRRGILAEHGGRYTGRPTIVPGKAWCLAAWQVWESMMHVQHGVAPCHASQLHAWSSMHGRLQALHHPCTALWSCASGLSGTKLAYLGPCLACVPCGGSELAGASRCRSSSREFLQVRLRRDARTLCTPARMEVDRSQLCTSSVVREWKSDRSRQVGSLQTT